MSLDPDVLGLNTDPLIVSARLVGLEVQFLCYLLFQLF